MLAHLKTLFLLGIAQIGDFDTFFFQSEKVAKIGVQGAGWGVQIDVDTFFKSENVAPIACGGEERGNLRNAQKKRCFFFLDSYPKDLRKPVPKD